MPSTTAPSEFPPFFFETYPQGMPTDNYNFSIPDYMTPATQTQPSNIQPGSMPGMMPNTTPSQPSMIPTPPSQPGMTPSTPLNQPSMVPPMGVPMFPLYGYDNVADFEKDVIYLRYLYPKTAYTIQCEIDKEADHLDYDGSLIFDENPDKVSLERIADRIYDKIKDSLEQPKVEAESIYMFPTDSRNDFLHDLIYVMFLNEVFNRRRRHRGRKRWF